MSDIQRVLHLHFGERGGKERAFVNLAQAFRRYGVEQHFVIRPRIFWRRDIEKLGPITENHNRILSLMRLILKHRIRRLCRSWRPHVIMAWSPRTTRLIPKWSEALKVARLGHFPSSRQLKRHLFSRCDVLLANSPAIAKHCHALGWEGTIQTIPNLVYDVKPQPVHKADFDTPEDVFTICAVGRFVPEKGFDVLVRALTYLPDVYLWLIGEGNERGNLESLAYHSGITSRVRFIDWVTEPAHYYAATNVLVVPSRTEAFGTVVLEGWQARVPVISTRSEGPSGYMVDGKNGLLVDIDDTNGLVCAINKIRDEPTLADRLVTGGATSLEEKFSERKIVDEYLALFSGKLSL